MITKATEIYKLAMGASLTVKIAVVSVPVLLALLSAIRSCNEKTIEDTIAEDAVNTIIIGESIKDIKNTAVKIKAPTFNEVKIEHKEKFNEGRDSDSGVF